MDGKYPVKDSFLLSLLLIVLAAALLSCAAPAAPSQALPAPTAPPILPSAPVVRLHTEIFEGPSDTINTGTVTFKWASALSSVDPSALTYSTFLQGYDKDYTPFLPGTSRTFTNLLSGAYVFYIKAQNTAGQIEAEPASRSFSIAGLPPPKVAPVTVPGGSGGSILVGGNVNRIVVGGDGSLLYALNSAGGRLYRSDNAGMGWQDISGRIAGTLPWVDLAIAPDDAQFVAVVTDGGRDIYISADGGATNFSSTGLAGGLAAGTAARCIAISPSYGSPQREIAAGTWNGAAGGTVLIDVLTSFGGGWFNAGTGTSGWSPPGGGSVDVAAIKYSPSADGTLLLVASSATQTSLYMGARDLGSRGTTWNTSTGYPVELCTPGAGTPGTPLNYADISLPSDYNITPYSRQAFVSWSRNHPSQDVYRIVDSLPYRMNAPEPIASIAFYGTTMNGKLLAGAAKCIASGGCYQIQNIPLHQPDFHLSFLAAQPESSHGLTGSHGSLVKRRQNGLCGHQRH